MTETVTLSTHKKRLRASLTRLGTRLGELEGRTGAPTSLDNARRMLQRLESLDADFKKHHLALVDMIDDEEALAEEQETLDGHDDEIAHLAERIQLVISASTPDHALSLSSPTNSLSKRLLHVQKGVSRVRDSVAEMSGTSVDVCCLKQHEEQVADYKTELRTLSCDILSLDLEEGDPLLESEAALSKAIFDGSVEIKRLLQSRSSGSGASESKGVKLPKLDVPTFDGHILNWTSFWEQFVISVHDRSDISNAEKLVYLRHAVKDGSAKHVVEGLSHSGKQYTEAVESLQARYSLTSWS